MAALNFPTNPNNGDVYGGYEYNAAKGVWVVIQGIAPATIDGLTDVSVDPAVADDHTLLYNSTSGLWESSAIPASAITSGTFDVARIPTGTTSSTVSLGDHIHDDRYYTESETDTLLSGKANSSHTHGAADLPNLESLNGTLDIASGGTGVTSVINLRATKTTNTTLNASTYTPLTYQTILSAGITETSSSRFTIVTSGLYMLTASQYVNNTSWGALKLVVNGSDLGPTMSAPNRAGSSNVQVMQIAQLDAGYYVEVFAISDGAYPATFGTLQIALLGKL